MSRISASARLRTVADAGFHLRDHAREHSDGDRVHQSARQLVLARALRHRHVEAQRLDIVLLLRAAAIAAAAAVVGARRQCIRSDVDARDGNALRAGVDMRVRVRARVTSFRAKVASASCSSSASWRIGRVEINRVQFVQFARVCQRVRVLDNRRQIVCLAL